MREEALLRTAKSVNLSIAGDLSGVLSRGHDDGALVLATGAAGEQTFAVTAVDVAGKLTVHCKLDISNHFLKMVS